MSDPAVIVDHISHRYGPTTALDDISFEIPRGKLTGLLGPNGSGKTTLFRLLATLMPVQSGRITILGHDVMDAPAAVRRTLGVTFQSPALDSRLTVRENLHCHGRLYGVDRKTLRRRIDESLKRLELTDRRDTRVDELSGGLRRRAELAKGLLHDPQILLLDEPSTGLDVLARRRFRDVLDTIRHESGTTVIVSTHLMDEAEHCDQLFLLNAGQLILAGSPGDLQERVTGSRVTVRVSGQESTRQQVADLFGEPLTETDDRLSFRLENAGERVRQLLETSDAGILSVEVAQASLDDVFVDATGRRLKKN